MKRTKTWDHSTAERIAAKCEPKRKTVGEAIQERVDEYKRFAAKNDPEVNWASLYRSQIWIEKYIAERALEAIDAIANSKRTNE